jgi:hypothetical protein
MGGWVGKLDLHLRRQALIGLISLTHVRPGENARQACLKGHTPPLYGVRTNQPQARTRLSVSVQH